MQFQSQRLVMLRSDVFVTADGRPDKPRIDMHDVIYIHLAVSGVSCAVYFLRFTQLT